ncbi:MAG: RidA family protein [Phycisphaerae bacterium]|jgi:enamine deaminase RidA (YjgF/YER057c/UK114 family)|nr:RidA family protein [Phycisphaerae bacterium]HOO16194.1 RidA family protein [Phycisphaerae bacterium]HPC21880.1 RidA family protein [Phycisphaerae bacterium]HRS27733.1 RidA family protein [Phycisphaerae bacterium]HRT42373.1 RidA family protein [Phycisphaerae bacterium]
MSQTSQRLKDLNITLPPVSKPVGAYVPALRHGDLLMLSGQIPLREGKVAFTDKVGGPAGRTLEDAQAAARLCTLNAIAVAADAAGGVDRIKSVLKLVVYVASNPGFTDQHKVANGASDLLVEVFGEAGKHARAAVGVAELPLNSTVEVDVTFVVS